MESSALARLRRVSSKQTTRLSHYGRKTGKPHEVTIWFILDGDRLYVGTANVNRQWVRNVQKTPIQVSHRGQKFRWHCSLPQRPRRARTRHGCHSAKVLDVPPNHRVWSAPRSIGRDARQYGIVTLAG